MPQNKSGKQSHFVLVVFLIILLAIWTFCFYPRNLVEPVEKTLRFTYTLKNTSDSVIDRADFIAMMPAEIPDAQHVDAIITSEKYELLNQDPLNQSIKFTLRQFPPFATKVINLTLKLRMSSGPKHSLSSRKIYLQDEKYIETTSAGVTELAQQWDHKSPRGYAQTAYQWLIDNLQDAGYVSDNKGAAYAIEKRVGDCTEHMFAFVALARADKIPARAMAGFVVPQSAAILNAADYHNWAEFYDGQWILVDSQKRTFDAHYENYIVTRVVSGTNNSTESANRFLTTDSRIAVSF